MRRLVFAFLFLFAISGVYAQQEQMYKVEMGLQEVISVAHSQSPGAILARHNFIVSYWQFRTYKAQFLPSLNLQGTLGNYNRSLVPLQSSETGEIGYLENNTLRNALSLSVDQNIPFTGGAVSVITSLDRLDQFSPFDRITYNSQPVKITYSQPINGFNSFKWEKRIEPKRFEVAKKEYVASMEDITVSAVSYFFNLLIAQKQRVMKEVSRENTRQMYRIASERFAIGSISKDELLQLELKLLNDSLAVADNMVAEINAMQRLRNFLGYNEKVEIRLLEPPHYDTFQLDYGFVMDMLRTNSPDILNNEIALVEAQRSIAQAKSAAGIKASLYAQFGLNQVGDKFDNAYRSPLDQEVMGLTLSLPIMDWGLGKGKVKVAKSKAKVIQAQIDQSMGKLMEDISLMVMRFNMQGGQCEVSYRADKVGQERYKTTKERFVNGTVGVLELNNAQQEMDNAQLRFLNELCNYWVYYYDLRRIALYDFIGDRSIEYDFNNIVND